MTEITATPAPATQTSADNDSDKIRGRIPRGAWAYVRGQYELVGRTYEDIGNEFNATPSAVFYVVKQARDANIEATLERPSAEVIAAARAGRKYPRRAAGSYLRTSTSQVEIMAAQASAMLNNETCNRVFQAATETILAYVAFEKEANDETRAKAKECLHDARRALASLELKVEMTPNSVKETAPEAAAV